METICVIDIKRVELEELCRLQGKPRGDYSAVFSTNRYAIWPFARWGKTPPEDIRDLKGKFPVLDRIADALVAARPYGGRFFIDSTGAYFRDLENGPAMQFVQFRMKDRIPPLGMRGNN